MGHGEPRCSWPSLVVTETVDTQRARRRSYQRGEDVSGRYGGRWRPRGRTQLSVNSVSIAARCPFTRPSGRRRDASPPRQAGRDRGARGRLQPRQRMEPTLTTTPTPSGKPLLCRLNIHPVGVWSTHLRAATTEGAPSAARTTRAASPRVGPATSLPAEALEPRGGSGLFPLLRKVRSSRRATSSARPARRVAPGPSVIPGGWTTANDGGRSFAFPREARCRSLHDRGWRPSPVYDPWSRPCFQAAKASFLW